MEDEDKLERERRKAIREEARRIDMEDRKRRAQFRKEFEEREAKG